jgi:hypothetical protein
MGALLQLMGKGSDKQIATEARRRPRAMRLTPGNPQIVRRSSDQFGDLAFDLGNLSTARPRLPIAVPIASGRRLARALASQSIVDCRFHTIAGPSMR